MTEVLHANYLRGDFSMKHHMMKQKSTIFDRFQCMMITKDHHD